MREHRTSVDVLPLYHHFALRDCFTELDLEAIHRLMQTARDRIAVSDNSQIIISTEATRPVSVQLELSAAEPPSDGLDGWDDLRVLQLECPTGGMCIDQPSAPAVDLRDDFPLASGTYGVHVQWRQRVTRASEPDDDSEADREQYLIRMWRIGDLPPATLAERAEDFDED